MDAQTNIDRGLDAEESETGQRLTAAMNRAAALRVISLSNELEALKAWTS